MPADHDLLGRHARHAIELALADTRVVLVNGARQAGKSTLARQIATQRRTEDVRYLDDAATRAAAAADPTAFVRHDGLLVIDEVQRVPDLILAIKNTVDLDPSPGQFLLTGSARLFELSSIPDALPGRAETIELWPLSQGEIDGMPDGFVSAVFGRGADLAITRSPLTRSDYVERALRGGYPEAVHRDDPGRRSRFFENYVGDLIQRDVRQLRDLERPADMRRIVNAVAAQIATLLVPNNLANRLTMPISTVKRYLDLLELVFFVRRIPAWSNNLTTRAVGTPKLLLTDSGLAAHLNGLSLSRARQPTAQIGPLLENFVLSELARQLTWASDPISLHHYRDRDGNEVDAVLEHASGEIVAIEVKASETVRAEDFRGIEHLARKVGDRLVAGVVLYAGPAPLSFGDKRRAWPISSLWTT